MNFLAHAVLSFDNPDLLAGNMISDFVKGKTKFSFSKPVQRGIDLHRMIDDFTDRHPATHDAKSIFRSSYRLYSGPIVDILYDHFLANDSGEFATMAALDAFARGTYRLLENYSEIFPEVFAMVFHYMKADNWLAGYREVSGIRKSLNGLVRRAQYMPSATAAYNLFTEHYSLLQSCYDRFFPEVKSFALECLRNQRAD